MRTEWRAHLITLAVAALASAIIWTPVLGYTYLKNIYSAGVDFSNNGDTGWIAASAHAVRAHHSKLNLPRLNITIHSVDEERRDKECCPPPGCRQDDGRMSPPGSAQACTAIDEKTGHVDIWLVAEDARQVLLHELAHADGSYTDAEVEKMFP